MGIAISIQVTRLSRQLQAQPSSEGLVKRLFLTAVHRDRFLGTIQRLQEPIINRVLADAFHFARMESESEKSVQVV